MKKNVKRYLSLVLALCMLAVCVPMSAMAADSNVIYERSLTTRAEIIGKQNINGTWTDGYINTEYIGHFGMDTAEWSETESAALIKPLKTETTNYGYIIPKDGNWGTVNFVKGEEYTIELEVKPVDNVEFYLAQSGLLEGTKIAFEATDEWKKYACPFTANADAALAIYLEGGASYIKNLKISKKINPELVSSVPANGSNIISTNEVSLTFSTPMGDSALNEANYKVASGSETIAISDVATTDNLTYKLTLSSETANNKIYTVSYSGLKTALGEDMPNGETSFISGGTKVIDYPLTTRAEIIGKQNINGTWTDGYINTQYIGHYGMDTAEWSETESAALIKNKEESAYLQIKDGSNNWALVNFTGGQEYMFELEVKPVEDTTFFIAQGTAIKNTAYTFTENEWQKYSLSFTAAKTADLAIYVSGKAYIKNLKIYKPYEQPATFELVSSTPEDGGKTGIKKFVEVEFSSPLASASLNAENFKLSGGTQSVKDVEDLGNNKYKVVFDKMLTEKTVYSLSMNVTDFFGRTLTDSITFATPVEIVQKNTFSTDAERNICWMMFATDMGFQVWNGKNEDADGNIQTDIVTSARLYKKDAGSAGYPIIYHGQPNAAGNGVEQIQFQPGNTYTISMDMKGTKDFSLKIYRNGIDMNKSFEIKKDEWNTYSYTFTPAAVGNVGYNVTAEVGDSIYVDNIYITKESADKLYFDETKLYSGGTELTTELASGEVTAVVDDIMNYSGSDLPLTLVIAYYENNVLMDSDAMDIANKKNTITEADLTASVTVGEKVSGVKREVKAFLWNTQTLAPVVTVKTITD